jgi:tripartite-type tricarboxylate transporter receptor subunit TctC
MTWDTYALLATSNTRWGLKDIIPVALMIKQPSSFLTATNGNLKTWADVEREARKQPLKVAVTGFGSPDEITVNFFIARGLKLISVPFANPGERYTAVLGGHADLLYEQIGDVRSFVDSKQIQPVIVFADKRFGVFPDVPASKELGYDITLPQRRAVIMKAGTDPQKVKVIAAALAKVAASPEYKAYLKEQYATEDSYFGTEESLKIMEEELAQMKRMSAPPAPK